MDLNQSHTMLFQAIINDKSIQLEVDPQRTLLDILREDLDLMGAKKACDIGTCGSCTVIMNGKGILACITPAERAHGKSIQTIEGISQNGKLHPLQEAFIKGHGFQCGICTPGFIMAAKALLDKNPNPTDQQIKTALKTNICRCTGYQQLIESVKLAAGQLKEEDIKARETDKFRIAQYADEEDQHLPWARRDFKIIGKPQPRIESESWVTGKAKYTADYKIPGMIWGVTVRSTHTHARILNIDTSSAEQMAGVYRVLTWKDVPGENAYGKKIRDQQVFARDKVRYYGEPIALVVAGTKKIAEEAARLIKVDYEILPGVYDPEEAMKPDAPQVHEKGNILSHYHLEKGDIAQGFAEAEVIIERKYTTQPQDHSPLEPEAALAYYGEDGKLTVISPGQSVFFDRLNIIRALGVPKEDVRCIQAAIGAAYGKREAIYAQIHAALATFLTGKPVKIEYSREETMLVTTKRTQLRTYLKTGVKKTGEIVALEARIIGDAGAYASWSLNIMRKAGVLVSGPYEIPHIKVDSYAVYTNNPITCATRGFGAAETEFCTESHVDEMAHAIGMDPMEFRLKNVLRCGSKTSTNFQLDFYIPATDTILEADKNFHWREKKSLPKVVSDDIRRGVGMATIWYGIGFGSGIEDTTDVIVELNEDGTATVYVGTVDYGNGSNTTFAMLTAEMLGLSLDKINLVNGDSDRTKNCGSTVATKQTYTTGNAVVSACIPLRKDIFFIASKLLNIPEEEVDIGFNEAYFIKDPAKRISIASIARQFRQFGKPRRREGLFQHQKLTTPLDPKTGTGKAWFPIAFGTQMAEVEVNVKTGKVKVLKIVAAHHVGRALNPQSVRGQIVGGISFGWGFALCEDANYQNGIPQNLNYDKYKLMRSTDYPDIEVIALEKDEKSGPFGAIGIGEPPTIPVAPAIANAVHDAVGVRVYDLPITPEKVRSLLSL